MKKIFKYIENIWIGDDGKPSGKRITALTFGAQLLYSAFSNINTYTTLIKYALLKPADVDANKIAAAGSSLSAFAMVFAAEAALIAALWGIAGYQSIKFKDSE